MVEVAAKITAAMESVQFSAIGSTPATYPSARGASTTHPAALSGSAFKLKPPEREPLSIAAHPVISAAVSICGTNVWGSGNQQASPNSARSSVENRAQSAGSV